jgi:hypothetical protein
MGFCYRVITKKQTRLNYNVYDYVNKYYSIIRGIIAEKNLLNNIQDVGNADERPIFIEISEKKL